MKTVDMKDVLRFHKKLIEKTGGSDGIRDYNLVDSALTEPLLHLMGKIYIQL